MVSWRAGEDKLGIAIGVLQDEGCYSPQQSIVQPMTQFERQSIEVDVL